MGSDNINKKQSKEAEERERLRDKFSHLRSSALSRFPLLFTLLGTLGLVATLYGFERVLDEVALFAENPWLLLVFGVAVLLGTGTLYKELNAPD